MLLVPSMTTRSPVAARMVNPSKLSMVTFSWYRPADTTISSCDDAFWTAPSMVDFGQSKVPFQRSLPFTAST